MADSGAFHQLDERIQRYIWNAQWSELREVQERSIPLIVTGDSDVIIAASTASGKTEAAFLPALTHYLGHDDRPLIVYISPLKALINDQFGRLETLCENLDIPVWPWHGDISSSQKQAFRSKPFGILLITPESLEATLCNRGTDISRLFQNTLFFIVDELHAFIGSERGKQLQSLLHRLEKSIGKRIPRIGLSATLGNMSLAAQFLRPGDESGVKIVDVKSSESGLGVLVKGYIEPAVLYIQRELETSGAEPGEDGRNGDEDIEHEPVAPAKIAAHLFKNLRGTNNLVFPNSRREVERYTHMLTRTCEAANIPNEFWPHHGSLSKEIRSDTEAALKQKQHPATAICTNTLELGIDIGAIKSVAQIGPPPSVASLRQRLGRSGRRPGESSILRGYCIEDELQSNSSTITRLRLGSVQLAAAISLLIERWFEPPVVRGLHFSTLIQQLLSSIAQLGGITAKDAFELLCGKGAPFEGVSGAEFVELLRHLGKIDLLVQESSGLLLHGTVGERLVNHYTFYAAFSTEEEFRIISGGKHLGSLPVAQTLRQGQHILFAGRTWRVEEINEQDKAIYVVPTRGGVPPKFEGGAGRVHKRVRERMRELLAGTDKLAYLDGTANQLLDEGRRAYRDLQLKTQTIVDAGSQVYVFTWLSDAANEVISNILSHKGFQCWLAGPAIEVIKGSQPLDAIISILKEAGENGIPPAEDLLQGASNLIVEKWDGALPKSLLLRTYSSLRLDTEEATAWLTSNYPAVH